MTARDTLAVPSASDAGRTPLELALANHARDGCAAGAFGDRRVRAPSAGGGPGHRRRGDRAPGPPVRPIARVFAAWNDARRHRNTNRRHREQVQQLLPRHGDLVLNRYRGGRHRAVPIVQYCPVCLGGITTAYPRRGWRFSFEVVRSPDGCLLFDACWKCGALVDLLSSTVPSLEFLCGKCGAPLAKAPSLRMNDAIPEPMPSAWSGWPR